MPRQRWTLMWLWLLLAVSRTEGGCPARCSCRRNELNQKQVLCDQGGMRDPSFMTNIDIDTQVLVVTAPPNKPNQLMIGPLFRRFQAFIEEISITHSGVPAIGEHSFFGLQLLQRLNLSGNQLTNLDRKNFKGLHSLQVLDLSNNQISSVPSGTFQFMPELRALNLSGNQLPALASNVFLSLSELQLLDLSGSSQASLEPAVFEDVPELRQLRCARCELTRISSRLYQKLPRLEVLDLSDNHLSQLRAGEYVQLRHLRELHLAGNHFGSLSSLPFSGHRLRTLDLSRNQLTRLPPDLFRDVRVRRLNLAENSLTSLPDKLLVSAGDHLHWLSLAGNDIDSSDIEDAGKMLSHVQHLSLADTGLVSLSDSFWESLPRLLSLNLSANYLMSISNHMLKPLTRLRKLDVSYNQLYMLSRTVVKQLENLREVRLHGNPWSCDECRIVPVLEFVKKQKRRSFGCGPTCLRCRQPDEFDGRPIHLLNVSELPACVDEVAVSHAERCRRQQASPGADPGLDRFCAAVRSQPPEVAASQLGVIVGCVLALLLLTALILALLVYNRHSAIYYTHEDERDDTDVYQKPDVNKNKKRVRIATIDEMNGKDERPFVDDERVGEFQNG